MKKMFSILVISMLAMTIQAFGHGGSHGEVVGAKAGELALHRVGKLVDLKKIDASFVSQFYAVQIQILEDGNEFGAAYRAIAYQVPGANGNQSKIEILLDGKGKALSHAVTNGSPSNASQWASLDPLSIGENAFHYVLENGSNETVKPYYEGFSEMTLAQVDGKAKATFKSTSTSKKLIVYLSFDGVVIGSEISQ